MSIVSPVCMTFANGGFPSAHAENHSSEAAVTVTRRPPAEPTGAIGELAAALAGGGVAFADAGAACGAGTGVTGGVAFATTSGGVAVFADWVGLVVAFVACATGAGLETAGVAGAAAEDACAVIGTAAGGCDAAGEPDAGLTDTGFDPVPGAGLDATTGFSITGGIVSGAVADFALCVLGALEPLGRKGP